MVAWRYEFYFVMLKTTFDSLRSFVNDCFDHSKLKFISPRRRNILHMSFMEMTKNVCCLYGGFHCRVEARVVQK